MEDSLSKAAGMVAYKPARCTVYPADRGAVIHSSASFNVVPQAFRLGFERKRARELAIDRMGAMMKARLTARSFDGGDYLLTGQTGKILIHQLTGFDTEAGAYCGVKGEIVSVQPKVSGGATQPVGTKVQSTFTCNGKYASIGWEGVAKLVSALFDIGMSDPEFDGINVSVFGKTGVSKDATKEEQADPFFAARGMLIGFSTSVNAKSAAKRAAAGKEPITAIVWSHVSDTQGNSLAEIAERVKKLPPINL